MNASKVGDFSTVIAIQPPAAVTVPVVPGVNTVPGAPTNLAEKVAGATTSTDIKIKWDDPTSNGGDAITSWKVYSDIGTGNALSLLTTVSSPTVKEYTHVLPVASAAAAPCYGLSSIATIEKQLFVE
jgi:hypothetical protein